MRTIETVQDLLKILADKNRLRIIALLEQRKMCVCELAFVLNITQPAVSKHLKRMKLLGVVGREKNGSWTDYYLRNDDQQFKVLLAEIRKWLQEDTVIKDDRVRMKKADRSRLCCKA